MTSAQLNAHFQPWSTSSLTKKLWWVGKGGQTTLSGVSSPIRSSARTCLLFGDFGQLQPVMDLPLYTTSALSDIGGSGYQSFHRAVVNVYYTRL